MNKCPICSDIILRHIYRHQIYWYCRSCHQTVPNFSQLAISNLLKQQDPILLSNPSLTALTPC